MFFYAGDICLVGNRRCINCTKFQERIHQPLCDINRPDLQQQHRGNNCANTTFKDRFNHRETFNIAVPHFATAGHSEKFQPPFWKIHFERVHKNRYRQKRPNKNINNSVTVSNKVFISTTRNHHKCIQYTWHKRRKV